MTATELILASGSPRRRQLLDEAGYRFRVEPPDDAAECGVCSGETPPQMAMRLARQKAEDVARRYDRGLFLGADTLVECRGQVLGKPRDEDHAREILRRMRGTVHHVFSGICLWERPGEAPRCWFDATELRMDDVSDADLEAYLETDLWEGKAGAFGYQDGLDWVHIVQGSPSNVVGLPMELLAEALREVAPDCLPSVD